jgi:sugar transferase (PEP-CTERM/EpsH1 system associated)
MSEHNPPLVVHIIYSLKAGGLENGLVNIINRTPAARFQHVIVCITEADGFADRITAENVSILQLHKREGHDIGFYWRLWRLMWKLRPDIIHSRNLAALETQLLGIGLPHIRRVHGEHGREITDLDGKNWKYLAFRKFMGMFIHRYIAVSRDLELWLTETVRLGPEKVRQIYNGVDHSRFFPQIVRPLALPGIPWQPVDDMLVIGTVGRLTPVKDQATLLRAIARLGEVAPVLFQRLRVLIAGDGPLREQLTALAVELGIAEIIWMTGDRDDIPELLSAMDVFVLPSLAEGISNTVLEAMSAGLPVIATAVGGNLELVEEGWNGCLVPVGDSYALANALNELLADENLLKQQGVNARKRMVEKFDWHRTVDEYLGVYEELLRFSRVETPESAG